MQKKKLKVEKRFYSNKKKLIYRGSLSSKDFSVNYPYSLINKKIRVMGGGYFGATKGALINKGGVICYIRKLLVII
jgi:tRNA 2-selenouridine synthase SelU